MYIFLAQMQSISSTFPVQCAWITTTSWKIKSMSGTYIRLKLFNNTRVSNLLSVYHYLHKLVYVTWIVLKQWLRIQLLGWRKGPPYTSSQTAGGQRLKIKFLSFFRSRSRHRLWGLLNYWDLCQSSRNK